MSDRSLMDPGDGMAPKVWRCGTLTYTKRTLAMLFFWLLWGDFCFTLMESVTWPIMQLKFQDLKASNLEVAIILSTVPQIFGASLNPVISFKSDRFRSRMGRRLPFLMVFLPFLVLALVALAFGDQLGYWLHAHVLTSLPEASVVIWTLAVLIFAFALLNIFGTTTFWYLFNDVVPEHLLARFMSWFRFISALASSLYTFLIFPFSRTHSTAIFLGAAGLYLGGFGLMLLNVREGKYPPAPAYSDGGTGVMSAVKTYATECHGNRIYWYFWLCTFIGSIGGGIGLFDLYFKQAIGLDLVEISRVNGTAQLLVTVMIIGAGWLADRYQPIRVVLAAQIVGLCALTPASLIWLFWHPAATATWTFGPIVIKQVFLVSLLIYVGIGAPVAALTAMWDPVMLMRTFPRSRYGQFCSTNNLWRTAGGIVGGMAAGAFLDALTPHVGRERAYFFGPVWSLCFAVPAFAFFLLFFREWKRHGGDAYVAPLPEGTDEMAEEATTSVVPEEPEEPEKPEVPVGV